jgi:hypothetical protein
MRNPSAQLHFANEAPGRLFTSVQLVAADDSRRIAIVIPSNLDVRSVNEIARSGPSCRAKLFFCSERSAAASLDMLDRKGMWEALNKHIWQQNTSSGILWDN